MLSKPEHCNTVLDLWSPIKEKAYWIVAGIVNDRELAEDVLQESLITAIEKFQTLRDIGKFEPWFITISIRKSYEVLASRKAFTNMISLEESYLQEEGDSGPDDAYSTLQYKDMIVLILKSLRPETKKYLFYLRYIEDRSMESIMDITGLKEGTLKSIYSRMRKEIGKLLGKEYDIDDRNEKRR